MADLKPPINVDKPGLDPAELVKLRDQFAACALIGLAGNSQLISSASQVQSVATLAYANAKAMMDERQKLIDAELEAAVPAPKK